MTQPSTLGATPSATRRDPVATAVVVALVLVAVVDVWSIAAELHRASLMSDVNRLGPSALSYGTATAADRQVQHAAITSLLLLLVTGILFIVWLHRVDRQLRQVNPGVFRYSSGWTIGSWFVPFLNLVRPKQIVDDTYAATFPATGPRRPVPAYVHFWWAAWLIANAITWIGVRTDRSTASGLATSDRIAAVGDLLDIVAAGLATAVVLTISRRATQVPPPAPMPVYAANYVFNPPPGWPVPPSDWTPPPGWTPDPSWPPAPAGWQFWAPRQ